MGKYFAAFILFRDMQRRMIPPCNRNKWEIEAEDTAEALEFCDGREDLEFTLYQRFIDRTVWAKREPSWSFSFPALLPRKGETRKEYFNRCERAEWEYVLQNGGKYAR